MARKGNCTIQAAVGTSLCLLAVMIASGCGRSDGPHRYEVSGRVTYQGKPVPVGTVQFVPDTSKGNSGPATAAVIDQGRYCTRPGKGTVGGPHVVIVAGSDAIAFDSPEGRQLEGMPLFSAYRTHVDLPNESCVQDFDVPVTPEADE